MQEAKLKSRRLVAGGIPKVSSVKCPPGSLQVSKPSGPKGRGREYSVPPKTSACALNRHRLHVEKMRPCRGLGAEMEWAQGVRARGYRRGWSGLVP